MSDILHLINILRRYLLHIIFAVVVTCLATYFGTSLITPTYTAVSTVRVLSVNEGNISNPLFDNLYAERLMNTYAIVGTNREIINQLVTLLALDQVPDITITVVPNTELLRITVQATDPEVAALVANTLAELMVTNAAELVFGQGPNTSQLLAEDLEAIRADLDDARNHYAELLTMRTGDLISPQTVELEIARQEVEFIEDSYFTALSEYQQVRALDLTRENEVSVANQAGVPTRPTSPDLLINLAIGAVVGLAGGIALAVILDLNDTRFHSSEEIESFTELPTLAQIPKLPKSARPIAVNSYPYGEGFRHLRLSLLSRLRSQTLVVVSAEPGAGRSLLIANLMQTLTQLNKRVVVIDCDLRKSDKTDYLAHITHGPPLVDLLTKTKPLVEALEPIRGTKQCVIPSLESVQSSAELLASPKMTALVNLLESRYDYVLIDTPAYLSASDAAIVSSKLKYDGVIVVVRNHKTHRNTVSMMLKSLRKQNIGIIGSVVNFDRLGIGKRISQYYDDKKYSIQPTVTQLEAAFQLSEADAENIFWHDNHDNHEITTYPDKQDQTQPSRVSEYDVAGSSQ